MLCTFQKKRHTLRAVSVVCLKLQELNHDCVCLTGLLDYLYILYNKIRQHIEEYKQNKMDEGFAVLDRRSSPSLHINFLITLKIRNSPSHAFSVIRRRKAVFERRSPTKNVYQYKYVTSSKKPKPAFVPKYHRDFVGRRRSGRG